MILRFRASEYPRSASRHPRRRRGALGSSASCCPRAGTTAVEFALLMPAFFMIVFGIVEFSRCVWAQSALQFAVEKAARCAAVDAATCGTPSQVQQYALSKMLAPGATAATFTPTTASCGSLVSGSMAFTFLVKLVHGGSITLTAQSCYPA